MYYKTVFSLAIVFLLFSCQNTSDTASIELNNGEKWQVNAEMMPPIEASTKLISVFATNDNKDYKGLAEKLKENNKLLISSCTMDGKSHDELHKWLHPYMILVDELENAADESVGNEVFLKIEQSFETFNQYFQ